MSPTQRQITERFAELASQAEAIPLVGSNGDLASDKQFHSWAVSALHAIQGAFGKDSSHYLRFEHELSAISSNIIYERRLNVFRGIFLGAKSDVDGGHFINLQTAISGEIFGDFVTAAKAALTNGKHTVAAVLACAALEDALKRFALANGFTVEGKTMEEVVNALKAGGLVSGAPKGLLSAMPKIRNSAMHADWEKLTPQDAGSVIGFVEQFLLVNFR